MDISKYFNLKYKINGRGLKAVDCYGLVLLWYREELGIKLYDPQNDDIWFESDQELAGSPIFSENVYHDFVPVDENDIRQHDVLLICNQSNTPNHCGIVINPRQFLHILNGPGCHLGKLSAWRSKIVGFYRHKGLLDASSDNP